MVEVKCLSDDELQNELHKLGFPPGPILPSTRKVYEKKLVQLLVSTPCAPPKKNGPGELNRAQDNDDSEEFNATIILKRNITPSSEKSKGPKNRCKTSTSKPKAVEIFCSDSKRTEGRRCAARTSNIRCKALRNLKEKACCRANRRAGDSGLETFPMGLTLAVFGILVIVIFVYITMESKSLFG
ncbi:LEM domain-containing protein 1 [Bos taurus]|uniref:LEM domain-containing protein 1 n=1 Tax=Bos taurus TaxID=9913 RepID=UPI000179DB3B|nr:LEM domain-containing protein 1 [Bos taurus]